MNFFKNLYNHDLCNRPNVVVDIANNIWPLKS